MPKGVVAIDAPASRVDSGWAPPIPALAPVANRPLLQHAIDALREAGAEDVLVVGDASALGAARPLLDASAPEVERLATERPGSAADALLAAAGWLEGDDVIVHDGDGMLLRGAAPLRAAVAAAGGVDATVFFASGPEADAERVTGVHVFSAAILPVLRAVPPGPDGRRSLLEAVDRLAAHGGRVRAGVLESWWSWDGTPEHLLDANRIVLDALPAGRLRRRLDPASRIDGRVRIHPDAVVERAIIRGPVVIGAGARIIDAYVGPHTTIGEDAEIDNAEIECSIVLPRARIRHVGVRVEASIVGAGATVGRDFALPKALRLLIGRDASITLG